MRNFETGATRDKEDGKYDYEGFLSPLVVERFGQYMDKHRKQADGALRASDNWQKGIPKEAYMKSGWRHFMDWWKGHRGFYVRDGIEEAMCALMFNVMGYLHEHLKQKQATIVSGLSATPWPPLPHTIMPGGATLRAEVPPGTQWTATSQPSHDTQKPASLG